jgi:hypothetical protein
MQEPKYKLSKRDKARWRELVAREAVNLGPPNKEFPPLSPAERIELERLQRKQMRKIWAHPRMREPRRLARNQTRRLRRLAQKIRSLTRRLNNSVDSGK